MGIGGHFDLPDGDGLGALTFRLRAARLGLVFDPAPSGAVVPAAIADGDAGTLATAIRVGRAALLREGGATSLLIAPRDADIDRLAAVLNRAPTLRDRVRVTTPAAIRQALTEAGAAPLLHDALERLPRRRPDLSARRLVTNGQIAIFLLFFALIAGAIVGLGWQAVALLDVLAGLLFLSLVLLRLLCVGVVLGRMIRPPPRDAIDRAQLPVYSVLVPLHDEAHMVADLVQGLKRLDWPRDRLDIKIILEARDRSTRLAVAALQLEAPFEIVVVPDSAPRTKPKALAFTLPLARGEFVTVYDAEDRPDPGQLIEAYAAFRRGGDRLACVQAPLWIDNADLNGLTGLFAMEYAIQFDGILPTLATLDLPLPLGGTSNHFRRVALEKVGGWDPYNVTEDADLGIRLARFGLRAGTITRPTLEEAPRTSRLWVRQRTRWLKGWMQTWLVHMRDPIRLWREIGTLRFVGFMLTSLGAIVAAAVYPVYLATALMLLLDPGLSWRAASPLGAAMIALNVFNFVSAYAVFGLLAHLTMRLRGARCPPGTLPFLPAYWLLLSLACYRALFQLIVAPHRWEKTPHHGGARPSFHPPGRRRQVPPPLRAQL